MTRVLQLLSHTPRLRGWGREHVCWWGWCHCEQNLIAINSCGNFGAPL